MHEQAVLLLLRKVDQRLQALLIEARVDQPFLRGSRSRQRQWRRGGGSMAPKAKAKSKAKAKAKSKAKAKAKSKSKGEVEVDAVEDPAAELVGSRVRKVSKAGLASPHLLLPDFDKFLCKKTIR